MIPAFQESLLGYRSDVETEIVANAFVSNGRNAAGTVSPSPGRLKLAIGPSKRTANLPLISCLMPTKNRYEQAKMAIASFRRQTWPNKELIVLDQNLDDRLSSWIGALNDPAIRLFHMPGLKEPLGTIRNRTVALASGVLLCVWDDDDMQHPARLEVVAAAMSATRSAACVMVRETVWMPAQPQRVCIRRARFYCHTLVALRQVELRYAPLPIGEDQPAVQAILARHRTVWLDLPELYLYVVHGGNISGAPGASYWDRLWQHATDRAEGDASESTLAQLARIYPIAEYAEVLAAREPDGAVAAAGAA